MAESVATRAFILVVDVKNLGSSRSDWERMLERNLRACHQITGPGAGRVAEQVCEALNLKHRYALCRPYFSTVYKNAEYMTPIRVALWERHIEEIACEHADPKSDDELERFAAYRKDALAFEMSIRREQSSARSSYELGTHPASQADSHDAPQGVAAGERQEIPSRVATVWHQYQWAIDTSSNKKLSDEAAYKLFQQRSKSEGEEEDLPGFETWRRYLSEYRRLARLQKNQPRANRSSATGSIIRDSDL